MRRSRSATFILFLALVLLVSACSSGNNATNTEVKGEEKKVATPEKAPEAEKKEATINFWFPGNEPEIDAAVKQIALNFEKANPHIKVEVTTIPWKDFFPKLSVAYAGGIEPDAHGLGFGQLISTVEQDKYMDLNKFIQADQWVGKEDTFENILKSGEWKGGQYGLLIPETRPFVWRKDFLAEANLEPNSPPTSLDQIYEYAKKLTVKDGKRTERAGIDIQTSNGEQSLLSLLLLQGINIYDEKGNPTFDSNETIATVAKLVELFKEGAILPASQQELQGTPFQNSLAAMGFQSSYSLAQLTKAIGEEKIGWSLPPKGPQGKQTALMLGTFLSMSKTSKNPNEAWEFIKYFYSPDQMFEFAKSTGFAPPLKSLEDKFVSLGAANKVIFETMSDSQGYLPSSSWGIIIKYLRVGLEEAYFEKKSPEQAMKDAAQKAREEIGIK